MKILGIETSCDETTAAIVNGGRKIISNIVASSSELHKKTGGIIPEVAAREQVKCIIPVIEEAMKPLGYMKTKMSNNKLLNNSKVNILNSQLLNYLITNIDAIAVTVGPGLIGSLLVGVETAKTISFVTGKPIIPVNHIFAHIYANWLHEEKPPEFPAIALVVSGGHTDLFLMRNHGSIKWLGGTRDDAAGEAFDKTARLLGLGYPGGPAISAEAEKFQISNFKFQIVIKLPRPMIGEDNFDFSFSGLKTAVFREINNLKVKKQFNNLATRLADRRVQQLAYEVQESITDVLVSKTIKACQTYKVKTLLLGGGVAANKRLTEKMKLEIRNLKLGIQFYCPPPSLCTDNAAYIASYAYFSNKPVPWKNIQAQPDLSVEV